MNYKIMIFCLILVSFFVPIASAEYVDFGPVEIEKSMGGLIFGVLPLLAMFLLIAYLIYISGFIQNSIGLLVDGFTTNPVFTVTSIIALVVVLWLTFKL